MEKIKRLAERALCMTIGASFLIVGLLFVVLGLSLLPVLGVFIGVALMSLSLYFFKNDVKVSEKNLEELVNPPQEYSCPWPRDAVKAA